MRRPRRPFWKRLLHRRRKPLLPSLFCRVLAVHMAGAEAGPVAYFDRKENR